MLFELAEIQKIESNLSSLQNTKKNGDQLLINAYSKRQLVKLSFNKTLQAVLKQSALLIHLFQSIQNQIATDSLLSQVLNQSQIDKLLYNKHNLPEWFQFVFAKQFQKQKKNIQIYAKKIFKLHDLSLRNRQLVKQHWNFQTLTNRYEALSIKEKQQFDITEQVQSLKNSCKHSKQILVNFFNLIVKNILTFLQESVQKSLAYSQSMNQTNVKNNLKINIQNSARPSAFQFYKQLNYLSPRTNNVSNFSKPLSPDYHLKSIELASTNANLQTYRSNQNLNNFFYRDSYKNQRNKDQTISFTQAQCTSLNKTKPKNKYNQPLNYQFRQKQNNYINTIDCSSPRKYINKEITNELRVSNQDYGNYQNQYQMDNLTQKDKISNIKSTSKNSKQVFLQYPLKRHCQIHCEGHCQNHKRQMHRDSSHCKNHDHLVNSHCSRHCGHSKNPAVQTQKAKGNLFNDYQLQFENKNRQFNLINKSNCFRANNRHNNDSYNNRHNDSYNRHNDSYTSRFNQHDYKKNYIPDSYNRTQSRDSSIRSQRTLQMKPYIYRANQIGTNTETYRSISPRRSQLFQHNRDKKCIQKNRNHKFNYKYYI